MPLGIDPKVDFAFKMVFGNPQHTRITIHFLNAVLSPPEPIDWVEILNPIRDKDRSDDKLVILDALASSGTPKTWRQRSCHACWWSLRTLKQPRCLT